MANTYTQLHVHAVFVVKNRNATIKPVWKPRLHQYICGIVSSNNHRMLAINSMPDHTHMLVGMRPSQSVSDLMQEIKGSSTKWINQQRFSPVRFQWQEGYGAFAVGKRDVFRVIDYIQSQEEHHRNYSFQEEYRKFLREEEVSFEERFLFTEMV